MKFNKLARELNLSVNELAEKVSDILPNANGGTEVSDEQKAQIIARLQAPSADSTLSTTAMAPILFSLSSLIALSKSPS